MRRSTTRPPGRNFGWPITEGPFTGTPGLTNPVYAYQHNAGTPTGCAITGGAFYNPPTPTFPASYIGKYFFADNCGDWIYYINPSIPATATQFADNINGPVDLKVGPDGALYYLARGAGSVGKILVRQRSADHATADNSHRAGWRHRDLHGERNRDDAALVSVAEKWREHSWSHVVSYITPPAAWPTTAAPIDAV